LALALGFTHDGGELDIATNTASGRVEAEVAEWRLKRQS